MPQSSITIYHNRDCGTSRSTLELIREQGIEPQIVEYMNTGWTRSQLERLLSMMSLHARDILRAKEPLADRLALNTSGITNHRILNAMVAHPVLVNRPIVVTPRGVRLCRPASTVISLLDTTERLSA